MCKDAPTPKTNWMKSFTPGRKVNIILQGMCIILICLMSFSLGLISDEIINNCSVQYKEATIIQRLKCFNKTESDICSECVHAGLANLYRVMVDGL